MANDKLLGIMKLCKGRHGLTYLPKTFTLIHPLLRNRQINRIRENSFSSGVQTSRIGATMFCRLRTNRKFSSHEQTDDERLLPAIELREYPIDTISDASPLAYPASKHNKSAFKRSVPTYRHQISSIDRIRRIADSVSLEKLGSFWDSITDPFQQRLRNQCVLLQDGEEQALCDAVETSSETLFEQGQGKGRLWRVQCRSGSDAGLRATVNWYFWSPEAGKNCPSLEFILMHLAPTHIWL